MASTTRLFQFAAVSALSGVVLLGCDDNPVAGSADDAESIVANPGFAVVDAGEGRTIRAFVRSRTGEPTLDPVSFTACDDKVTLSEDPNRVTVEPPDRIIVTGQTLGESCVVVSAAGRTDTVPVVVEAAALEVTSAPDTLRAGQSGEVVVTAVDANGEPVGPFARTDATYSSEDTAIVKVTDEIGSIDTRVSGGGVVTATWTGITGVTRSVDHTMTVLANIPVDATLPSSTFPPLVVDSTGELEAIAVDEFGNQNTLPSEILGLTVQSSNPSAVPVAGELRPTDGDVQAFIVAEGLVLDGEAEVTATLETSEGDFPLGPALAWVGPPSINLAPATGAPASDVTITGVLPPVGFDVQITVNGLMLADADHVSSDQIQATMPSFETAGPYDVQINVDGVSATVEDGWTQVGSVDPELTEPVNDDPGTPIDIAVPFDFSGSFGNGDIDDWFRFSVSRDVNVTITLDWEGDKDLDWIVFTEALDSADGAFDGVGCEGFFDHPEEQTCPLSAGTYILLLEDFSGTSDGDDDPTPVDYEVTGSALPQE